MKIHFLLFVGVLACCAVSAAPAPEAGPYEEGPVARAELGGIDLLVFSRLKTLGIEPANPCSDAVFIRRVFLDVIGTLPTTQETADFLASQDPDKRGKMIEHLLAREEFADYWAMKWSDLLRVKAEFPVNLWPNAAQAYHHWLRESVRTNQPYDQFVRTLLTASGSNFRVAPVNFYRAMQNREPQGIAQTVALSFMGTRAEKWPKEQLDGMAACFASVGFKSTAEWKEEIVFFNSGITNTLVTNGVPAQAVFPDGRRVKLSAARDPRAVFADWLVDPKNPWFTRSIANRVWSWLLGRGIVQEPDDLRPDNPPVNPELLAYLEREMIASKYDLRHLFRIILNSQTYQLSSIPRSTDPRAGANFASYPMRRLDAEVLIDSLCRLTATTEKYSSAIPEPFTFIPEGSRAIALPDGSITSPFLELFGRPSRDTGLETERNNTMSPAQRLHLLNSSQVQRKIEQSPLVAKLVKSAKQPEQVVPDLYLAMLSRPPTEAELKIASASLRSGPAREAAVDLVWALLNSAEFLYRH